MLNNVKQTLKKTAFGRLLVRHKFQRWTQRDERASAFYRQFIKPGDVVIDVGANRGNRAKIFLNLGAMTLMVEPQRTCIAYLKNVFRNEKNWVLIEAAVGRTAGEMEMLISSDDVLSTLSTKWLSAVKETSRFGARTWNSRQLTPVTTLDAMIKQYGVPSFIKIDVEGFESEVLAGLSVAPKALSFEFTPECEEITTECIDRIASLGDFEFQLSFGESLIFESERWLKSGEFKDYLRCNKRILEGGVACFGDIYARLSAS